MPVYAVIGCAAVDAGAEWLRLRTDTGAVRTIPWSNVALAGMGGGPLNIKGVAERTAPYLSTHDSLWVLSGDRSLAQLMIEKEGPRREAVLAAFAANLGERWRGDKLSTNELTDLMFKMPAPVKMPKMLVVMMVVMGVTVLLAMAALMFVRGK